MGKPHTESAVHAKAMARDKIETLQMHAIGHV